MIDSHCHIGMGEWKNETPALVERARQAGISRMLAVCCHPADFDDLCDLLKTYPDVCGAFGIHPSDAALCPDVDGLSAYFEQMSLVAVGETGFDLFYNPETKEVQQDVFWRHIQVAHRLQKPLIIHTRSAEKETLDVLKQAADDGLLSDRPGVFHCFSGSWRLMNEALKLGFFISASGMITFKNADSLRETFFDVPLDRLLIETDAPFLAPVPYRGKRNEPSFLPQTARVLAQIKGMDEADLIRQTDLNFNVLFGGQA